jgi:hypothetical protein
MKRLIAKDTISANRTLSIVSDRYVLDGFRNSEMKSSKDILTNFCASNLVRFKIDRIFRIYSFYKIHPKSTPKTKAKNENTFVRARQSVKYQ